MSRHRNIRNLDLDDELDDDYADDYYEEDEEPYHEDDEDEYSAYVAPDTAAKPSVAPAPQRPKPKPSELENAVRAVVGDSFTDAEVGEALRRYDNNVERAVNALLDGGIVAPPPPGFSGPPPGLAPPPGFSGPPLGLASPPGLAQTSSKEEPKLLESSETGSFDVRDVEDDGFECETVQPIAVVIPARTLNRQSNDEAVRKVAVRRAASEDYGKTAMKGSIVNPMGSLKTSLDEAKMGGDRVSETDMRGSTAPTSEPKEKSSFAVRIARPSDTQQLHASIVPSGRNTVIVVLAQFDIISPAAVGRSQQWPFSNFPSVQPAHSQYTVRRHGIQPRRHPVANKPKRWEFPVIELPIRTSYCRRANSIGTCYIVASRQWQWAIFIRPPAEFSKSCVSEQPGLIGLNGQRTLDIRTSPQPGRALGGFFHLSQPSTAATPGRSKTETPLIATPSAFAEFLLDGGRPEVASTESNDVSVYPSSILVKPTAETVQPFAFDTPSPDDRVSAARSKATQGKSHKSTTSDRSKVSAASTPTPAPRTTLTQLQSDMEGMNLTPTVRSHETLPDTDRLMPPALQQRMGGSAPSSPQLRPTPPAMSRTGSSTGSRGSKQAKRINVVEEYKKRVAEKDNLNLVVVGHVDAGKSTLMGHLLYLLGEVNERTMKKYERDAEKMKKSSFAFAWVLDETDEERSRGVTIDVAITKFETPNRKFTLLDAPGHKDFIPNMISGASQADVAILVVDSTYGEFETGFDLGGQTREHAILIRSLGVNQLIVAVNKLDVTNWSKERFDQISEKLTTFLAQVGFRKQKVWFIPTSGFTGENLKSRTAEDLKAWYSGPTLVEQIDAFEIPQRPIERPFRLSVADLFKGGLGTGGGTVSVSGRIESGNVQAGDSVAVMPINELGVVRAIEMNVESVKWAAAGDNVVVSLSGLDILHLSTGNVLCDPSALIPVTSHFRAQIVTFDIQIPLTIGVPVVLHQQSLTEPATISRFVATLNKSTGEIAKKNPRVLTKNVTATVEIKVSRPICIETFKDSKELGRFMLRSGSTTVAAGIVLEILSYEKGGSKDGAP
ncbi:HBS1-like protein [Borealophlyctis nickersoniae]|nr:HBS1-like protein [Borealophlyctis nickersoniae]